MIDIPDSEDSDDDNSSRYEEDGQQDRDADKIKNLERKLQEATEREEESAKKVKILSDFFETEMSSNLKYRPTSTVEIQEGKGTVCTGSVVTHSEQSCQSDNLLVMHQQSHRGMLKNYVRKEAFKSLKVFHTRYPVIMPHRKPEIGDRRKFNLSHNPEIVSTIPLSTS